MDAQPDESTALLGLWSGVGLVIANMVGVGVLLATGFMALDLAPAQILLCWALGGLMALAGARAYAELAALIPRSGGEYRYLSELLHPAAGHLAGWTSLLVGFSAPVAVAAGAAGPYAQTLLPALDAQLVGAALILLVTLLHASQLSLSRGAQNTFAVIKCLLLLGFISLGLLKGSNAWPAWQPLGETQTGGFALFMGHLVWVIYAYSGWNAAVYAAGEFRDPSHTVPRALLLGCAIVSAAYLAVNWVFVANLGPLELREFLQHSESGRITLGHFITRDLIGDAGGRLMSGFVLLALFSSMSAMTYVGPRVYAAMARDGFLPAVFTGRRARPPRSAVLLQGAIALALFLTHSFATLVSNVGALLTLISALAVLCLLRLQFSPARTARPGRLAVLAGAVYVIVSVAMLYFVLQQNPTTLLWMGVLAGTTLLSYYAARSARARC